MKHKILLLFIYALLLVLVSCSPETRLQKSINRYGQKESAKYFVEHYPEYFKVIRDTVRDTIKVPVAIKTPELTFNTSVKDTGQDLNVVHENDSLRQEITRVNGLLRIKTKVKPQIIHDTVPYAVVIPCPDRVVPDVEKLNSGKKTVLDGVNWIKVFAFIGIGAFLLILFWLWRKSEKEK